jgi:branched-chain amino acid transport system ATP-binding protein
VLEVRDLEVSYSSVEAVRGVSIEVQDQEVVGVLGANGAGKTSTLRAITRLVPFRGTVTFDGVDLRGLEPDDVARLGLLHVPEGRHVFPGLSVHENLQVGATARCGRRGGMSIADVYDLFPALAPLRRRSGWALSGGEQQMVAIGRALVGAPRMLLLDEPSLGLAPVVVKAMFAALAEVQKSTPMLIVEQATSLLLRIASRGYVISGGEIVMTGSAEALSDRKSLLDSYLGHRGSKSSPTSEPSTGLPASTT